MQELTVCPVVQQRAQVLVGGTREARGRAMACGAQACKEGWKRKKGTAGRAESWRRPDTVDHRVGVGARPAAERRRPGERGPSPGRRSHLGDCSAADSLMEELRPRSTDEGITAALQLDGRCYALSVKEHARD